MELKLNLEVKKLSPFIHFTDRILLIGSCFTEHISQRMFENKFSVCENPNGILFNPVSICNALNSYIQNHQYSLDDLFYFLERWNSWDHHSRFSNTDKKTCLEQINNSIRTAHTFLKHADWLFITLGSAFVYYFKENGKSVANCHKYPQSNFEKKLLTLNETENILSETIINLQKFNPNIKAIFTVSPVRHLRDGFMENNRSKGILINAVHNVIEKTKQAFYFPAYELVMDDLRDYRFYAEDMVHPNNLATNYVWEKFMDACFDAKTKQLISEMNALNTAKNHKPFNATSEQHKKFLLSFFEKTKLLQLQFPGVDFNEELKYFSSYNIDSPIFHRSDK